MFGRAHKGMDPTAEIQRPPHFRSLARRTVRCLCLLSMFRFMATSWRVARAWLVSSGGEPRFGLPSGGIRSSTGSAGSAAAASAQGAAALFLQRGWYNLSGTWSTRKSGATQDGLKTTMASPTCVISDVRLWTSRPPRRAGRQNMPPAGWGTPAPFTGAPFDRSRTQSDGLRGGRPIRRAVRAARASESRPSSTTPASSMTAQTSILAESQNPRDNCAAPSLAV